jgi:hypothetical protein
VTAVAAPATATLARNLRRSTLGARAIDFSLTIDNWRMLITGAVRAHVRRAHQLRQA